MDHKWLIFYFAIALESDFSILESLVWIAKQPLSLKTFRKISEPKFTLIFGKRCIGKSRLAKQLSRYDNLIDINYYMANKAPKIPPSILLLDLSNTTVILDDIVWDIEQQRRFIELARKIQQTPKSQIIITFQYGLDIFLDVRHYVDCYLTSNFHYLKEKERMCENFLNIEVEKYPYLKEYQWFVWIPSLKYHGILNNYHNKLVKN